MKQTNELNLGLKTLDIDLSAQQQQKLLDFLALLYKWNRAYNLTAIRENQQRVALQLLDSLSILPYLPEGDILDIGSGGGLPGIPIAIARPHTKFTLVDSNSKKTRFLTQAKLELGLDNLDVVHGRIEEWQPDCIPTIITSRAFSELVKMVGWTRHLLEHRAELYAMKGQYPATEIDALAKQDVEFEIHKLQVPGIDAERHLVHVWCKRPAGGLATQIG